MITRPDPGTYDAVILAIAHDEFTAMGAEGIRAMGCNGAVSFDVKSTFAKSEREGRL